jgi:hypothetical protein
VEKKEKKRKKERLGALFGSQLLVTTPREMAIGGYVQGRGFSRPAWQR